MRSLLETKQFKALQVFEKEGISRGTLVQYVTRSAVGGIFVIDLGIVMSIITCDYQPYAKARVFWTNEIFHTQVLFPSEVTAGYTRALVK